MRMKKFLSKETDYPAKIQTTASKLKRLRFSNNPWNWPSPVVSLVSTWAELGEGRERKRDISTKE